MTGHPGDDWRDYKREVLHRLDELGERFERMESQNRADHQNVVSELSNVKTEIASLKTKASLFGAMAGMGSSAMVLIAAIFGFRPLH